MKLFVILFIYVIFYIIFMIFKDGPILWKNLFCISLLPYFYMVEKAISSFFGMQSFFGGTISGFDAVWTTIIMLFIFACYIYIPALVLLIISIKKVFKN